MTAPPYEGLKPEVVLDAVESVGLQVDGRLLALNSFENRVYQVGIEQASPVIAKFYRPGRWTDEAIGEEHQFCRHLADLDIPVVAPLVFEGATLLRHEDYRFTLFPRQGGREPVLESDDNLQWMGRLLGRIHAAGQAVKFSHRGHQLDAEATAGAAQFLFESDLIPFETKSRYKQVTDTLLPLIASRFEQFEHTPQQSIHGDCHRGNVLWTDAGPHLVDLDDCRTGPVVQDFWMLLDGEPETQVRQLLSLLEGYEQFHEFDPAQLRLVEALRAQRMLEYAAWIGRRWSDPAFPRLFPWFIQGRYWDEHIQNLAEQITAMGRPPLSLTSH